MLAAVLVDDHINVNCIAPAAFPSKMTYDYMLSSEKGRELTAQSHPVGRIGNEEDMVCISCEI